MRAGASSLQQTLTPEAASVVKQSVMLARRRGHAQVTPLHVANTMLSSSTGLLRTACMQSHSHPLQCKALELCFNVALNRLPATSSTTTSTTFHHHHPSLSNALVAAFKRAQAHQRRGSIENQQQPLLAVKVEVEQLIISILDDPSVSRVMREAGFSSTQVKNNVELAVSLEISSHPSLSKPKEPNLGFPILNSGLKQTPFSSLDSVNNEDVLSLVDALLSRRRKSTVVIGECLVTAESVVRGLVGKIEKGEIPDPLKSAQFLSLPLCSFSHQCKDDVEQKLGELRCVLNRCIARGIILYVGDLKWTAEVTESYDDQRRKYFCPIEHIVLEIGRLVSDFVESGRFWLLGVASYHTFTRCKMGHPSLESLWGLHPLLIPAGSLGLSLNSERDMLGKGHDAGAGKQLTCCADCLNKFEMDVQALARTIHGNPTNLPLWMQQCKDQKLDPLSNDLDQFQIRELCRKWNGICNSLHKQHKQQAENTMSFFFSSPSSSVKFSSSWNHTELTSTNHSWEQHSICIPGRQATTLLDLPSCNSSPNSRNPDADTMKFKQFNAESLNSLCSALEQKVHRQKVIIPEIASVVLQCRSGMVRRKGLRTRERKEDTWLLFEGGDTEGKEIIARELANQIFSSEKSFVSIGLSSFSSVRADPSEDFRGKRCREEQDGFSYFGKLSEAIRYNPHRVVFLEDIEQVDYHSMINIKRSIERGMVFGPDGDEVSVGDAIVIMSCESFRSKSRACSPCVKQKSGGSSEEVEEERLSSVESGERDNGSSPCISLDLNLSVEDNESVEQYCEVELPKCVDRSFVFEVERAERFV
ncbi:protein SMAX1-LIKE 3-like [Nymphaea colorata]|nr:protein SMAX1-LIKE 3-like [Nymphaea colorata]